MKIVLIIATTVHATLPIRTASQGVSFAFIGDPLQVKNLVLIFKL